MSRAVHRRREGGSGSVWRMRVHRLEKRRFPVLLGEHIWTISYLTLLSAHLESVQLVSRYMARCGPGHPSAGCRGPRLPPQCRPIDELDSCCMAHDTCYDQNGCGAGGIVLNPTCWYCDCILWNCAYKADCTRSPDPKSCEKARRLILGIGLVRPWWCIVTAGSSKY